MSLQTALPRMPRRGSCGLGQGRRRRLRAAIAEGEVGSFVGGIVDLAAAVETDSAALFLARRKTAGAVGSCPFGAVATRYFGAVAAGYVDVVGAGYLDGGKGTRLFGSDLLDVRMWGDACGTRHGGDSQVLSIGLSAGERSNSLVRRL